MSRTRHHGTQRRIRMVSDGYWYRRVKRIRKAFRKRLRRLPLGEYPKALQRKAKGFKDHIL